MFSHLTDAQLGALMTIVALLAGAIGYLVKRRVSQSGTRSMAPPAPGMLRKPANLLTASDTLAAAGSAVPATTAANGSFRPIADISGGCEVPRMKSAFSLTLFAMLSACATGAAPPVASSNNPIPVEIVTGGDDGLTQRLADAVRGKFEKSSAFTLAPASATNALIVAIPTHVDWQDVGRKTRISYKLRLERAGSVLEESGGTCWESELDVCAESIVDAAGRATKL